MLRKLVFLSIVSFSWFSCNHPAGSETLAEKSAGIHNAVLTIDSHTDTPLWFSRGEFNLSEKHDAHEHGSRVDFPRMKEG
ncbi:MAG: hypothetical protein K9H16_08180, partial [Bacteroidales bacterium]|nr:hypothetical protein [Bacteroidales bacterium]